MCMSVGVRVCAHGVRACARMCGGREGYTCLYVHSNGKATIKCWVLLPTVSESWLVTVPKPLFLLIYNLTTFEHWNFLPITSSLSSALVVAPSWITTNHMHKKYIVQKVRDLEPNLPLQLCYRIPAIPVTY